MKQKKKDGRQPERMIYPYGFGFALMENPRAMQYFFSLNDERKRALMRTIREIESPEEMRGFLAGIVEQNAENTKKA